MISIRKAVCGVMAAGALTMGVGGVAYAEHGPQPPGSVPKPPSVGLRRDLKQDVETEITKRRCERAADRLAKVRALVGKAEARLAKLQAALAKAQAEGRTELVKKIQKRIDGLARRRDKAVDLISRVRARCTTP